MATSTHQDFLGFAIRRGEGGGDPRPLGRQIAQVAGIREADGREASKEGEARLFNFGTRGALRYFEVDVSHGAVDIDSRVERKYNGGLSNIFYI